MNISNKKTEKKQEIDELLSKSKDSSNNLNDCIELGEKILSTTAPEGREGIRLQIQDLQSSHEQFNEKLSKLQRDTQGNIAKLEEFEESINELNIWLKDIQEKIKGKFTLRATLDEKKAQLQTYRNMLQEVKSKQPVLDDLKEKQIMLNEDSILVQSVSRTYDQV